MAKEDRRTITDEIAIENIRAYDGPKGAYAYFDLVILPALEDDDDDMAVIKSCRIVDGQKGAFIAGPSHKSGDQYYPDAWINLTSDEIDAIKYIIDEATAKLKGSTDDKTEKKTRSRRK